MERFEEVLGDKKEVWREGTIIKDRNVLLDGETFRNPSFKDFVPAIEALLEAPMAKGAFLAPEGDTAVLFSGIEYPRGDINPMIFRSKYTTNRRGSEAPPPTLDDAT